MSEMIERVARAIAATIGDYSEGAGWLGEITHEIGLRKAGAAIEAMREPTDAMLFVGSNDEAGFTARNLQESWQLMVDEALKTCQAPCFSHSKRRRITKPHAN